MSKWCTHDESVNYVYFAFNIYVDGEHKRLAVNIRIPQGTIEISLRHMCSSNRKATLSEVQVQFTFSGLVFVVHVQQPPFELTEANVFTKL